jgi:prophage antirepressor-like protein
MIEEIEAVDNNCIVKAFENNPIAILQEDVDNKKVYYFKGSDIGKALHLTNIRQSIQSYDDDEKVVRKAYDPQGTLQDTTFLTSQGVYRLLYNSKKEVAKKFRKWAGNILDDIIFNESAELKRQLEEKEKQHQIELQENEKMLLEKETLLQEKDKKIEQLIMKPETEGFSVKPGYIYLIKDIASVGAYKIGLGENPDRRLITLNISSSQKSLKMVDMFKSKNMRYAEKIIHTLLEPFRIKKRNDESIRFDSSAWFYLCNETELNYAIYTIKNSILYTDKYDFIDYNSFRDYSLTIPNNLQDIKEEDINFEKPVKFTNNNFLSKKDKLSNYNGVSWSIQQNKWTSRLTKNNDTLFLGYYSTELEAAIVYNDYASYLNTTSNSNYQLNNVGNYVQNPRNIPEEINKVKLENKSSNYNGVYFIKSKQIFEASIQYKKKSYKLLKNTSDIECAKVYNEQALYFNNHVDTKYKLNDISNFVTNEKNHIHELEISKIKKYSRFVGVSVRNDSNKFRAYIKHNGKRIDCGTFVDEIDAAKSYNKKAEELNNINALNMCKIRYVLNEFDNDKCE